MQTISVQYISGGSIHNNKATLGGSIFSQNGALNISGGSIYSNMATFGAGLCLYEGDVYPEERQFPVITMWR